MSMNIVETSVIDDHDDSKLIENIESMSLDPLRLMTMMMMIDGNGNNNINNNVDNNYNVIEHFDNHSGDNISTTAIISPNINDNNNTNIDTNKMKYTNNNNMFDLSNKIISTKSLSSNNNVLKKIQNIFNNNNHGIYSLTSLNHKSDNVKGCSYTHNNNNNNEDNLVILKSSLSSSLLSLDIESSSPSPSPSSSSISSESVELPRLNSNEKIFKINCHMQQQPIPQQQQQHLKTNNVDNKIPGSLESINLDELDDFDENIHDVPSYLSSKAFNYLRLSEQQNRHRKLSSSSSFLSTGTTTLTSFSLTPSPISWISSFDSGKNNSYYSNEGISNDKRSSIIVDSIRFENHLNEAILNCLEYPKLNTLYLNYQLKNNESTLKIKSWSNLLKLSDYCLSLWEFSSINNLYKHFNVDQSIKTCDMMIGKPIDYVDIDPNQYLRNLLLSKHSEDKFKVLKRWSSEECLIQTKSNSKTFKFCSKTDEQIYPINLKSLNNRSKNIKNPKIKFNYNNGVQNNQKSLASIRFNRFSGKNKSTRSNQSFNNKLSQASNGVSSIRFNYDSNVIYGELSSLLQHYSSSVHFTIYITKYHQNYFQQNLYPCLFDLSSKLIFKSKYQNNQTNRLNLENLLKFDDTIVAVIRRYLSIQNPQQLYDQIRALKILIESACLLRQLRNFHGLSIVVASLKLSKLYFNHVWYHFKQLHPIHFRDFQTLSLFCQQLQQQGSMLSCIGYNYIPTIQSIMNRLRLKCSTTWNILDGPIRFTNEPSLAKWIEKQLNANDRNHHHYNDNSDKRSNELNVNLVFDMKSQTYLKQCSNDTVNIVNFDDYPETIGRRRRYLETITEQPFKFICQSNLWSTFVEHESRQSFLNYKLPENFF